MKKDAEKIRSRLAELHGGGRLTPEAVVADARSKSSPLHSSFNWDDGEAAHQWRLQQARGLIHSYKVEVVSTPREIGPVTVPKHRIEVGEYYPDPDAKGRQGYVSHAQLQADHALARRAVIHEMKLAGAYLKRARNLADSLGMSSHFDNLVRSYDRVGKKLGMNPLGD